MLGLARRCGEARQRGGEAARMATDRDQLVDEALQQGGVLDAVVVAEEVLDDSAARRDVGIPADEGQVAAKVMVSDAELAPHAVGVEPAGATELLQDGALLVDTAAGRRRVLAGDVSIRPQQD